MIRVLLVDDEPPARENLRLLLAREADVAIVGEAGSGPAAVQALGALDPDLVFLDVRMPGMDGFQVIQAVGVEAMPLTVFVTAFDRYALDAFEARALDYLLKPFDDARFGETMARVRRQLAGQGEAALVRRLASLLASPPRAQAPGGGAPLRHLTVRSQGRVRLLPVDEVEWFAAAGDYVEAHTGGGVHLLDDTLKALEAGLDPGRFVRIHRGHIVRVDRIAELEPAQHGDWVVRLAGGQELRMSRTRREALERALGRGL